MCFACKLSWQQPSLWHPREQQGAQSHPRKASDYLGPGPRQLCSSSSKEMCPRRAAEKKAGPMPSSQRNCCRTFPLDLGVLSGGKWGQGQSGRSPQGQRLGFPEEEGAH